MNKWVCLSHKLAPQTPAYGGGDCFKSETTKSIKKGDSCNVSKYSFSGHIGTHIDFPRHFYDKGQTLSDFDINYFIFSNPAKIELSNIQKGELINQTHFTGLKKNTDIIIIKTNWECKRNTKEYFLENPGIKYDVADYLRIQYPKLKAIGFDFISISSYLKREEGRKAHKSFLNPSHPILIIEDMKLKPINKSELKRIVLAPLLIEGSDGTPINVLGELL